MYTRQLRVCKSKKDRRARTMQTGSVIKAERALDRHSAIKRYNAAYYITKYYSCIFKKETTQCISNQHISWAITQTVKDNYYSVLNFFYFLVYLVLKLDFEISKNWVITVGMSILTWILMCFVYFFPDPVCNFSPVYKPPVLRPVTAALSPCAGEHTH